MGEWLSSWLAEQEASPLEVSEIGYLLLPSRDMAEIPLKRRKSSIQPTNQHVCRIFSKSLYKLDKRATVL